MRLHIIKQTGPAICAEKPMHDLVPSLQIPYSLAVPPTVLQSTVNKKDYTCSVTVPDKLYRISLFSVTENKDISVWAVLHRSHSAV